MTEQASKSDYLSEGFTPILCKGYHPKHNSGKDYNTAKQPVFNGWNSPDYVPPSLKEIEAWEKAGGWLGWKPPKGCIVVDNEDRTGRTLLNGIYKTKGIEPGIHNTNKGWHDFFKVPEGVALSGSSKVYTRCGLKVTYRVDNNQVILAPTNGRTWLTFKSLKDLPELPDGLLPYDRKDVDHVFRVLSWAVGTAYREGHFSGYDDLDTAFMVLLISCHLSEQQIHQGFELLFWDKYDERRTAMMFHRTLQRLEAGAPTIGAGSFMAKAKELELHEIERFVRELEAVTGSGRTVNEEWQEPLLFGEIETPELPSNLLPGYLGEYCHAVAEATQTPQGLAVMLGLSTVAACLQKRFEVSPYQDDYTEPLSMWTATALDSGNRKTAVKNAMTEPLTMWEKEQAESLKPKIKEVNHRRDINLQRINQLKAKAAKPETPAADREKYLQEILQIEDDTPDEIREPRVWTDDVTPERLQALLADHRERMALLSDEGGIFEVMSGLYTNGRANINVFLQGHAGSPVRVDRQGRTVMLNKPALTFGLAVQKEIIGNLSQGSKSHFRGNGTLARFSYCVPQSNIGTRDVKRRTVIPQTIKSNYQAGIIELLSIEPVYDEHGQEQPRILTLTPDALQAWQQFSQWIESRQGPDGEFYSLQDWTSKLPGAALRIAGLFHVIDCGTASPSIKRQTIEKALDLCELLISHARAAFDLMGDEPSTNDAKAIFSWILARKELSFRQNEVFKEIRRFRTLERLEKALKVLSSRNIISAPMQKKTGGRPSITYVVNPEALTLGRVQKAQKE